MKFHAAANIFPLDDETLDELSTNIKEHGLLCPIEVCDGKILDGRRRWQACRMAGVEPELVEVSPGDPVAYVLSLNLHRRHLSTTQRSMVGARAREFYDQAAKERQGKRHDLVENLPPSEAPTKARDAAGKAVGVSGKSLDHATRLLRQGTPELIAAVDNDEIAVSTAVRHVTKSAKEQRAFVSNVKKGKIRPRPAEQRIAEDKETTPGSSRGVGVTRAHEAIACLKRIPKSDALRKRGFQIVTDWIKHNK